MTAMRERWRRADPESLKPPMSGPVIGCIEPHQVLIGDDLEASSAERLIRRVLDGGAHLTLLDAGALGPRGVAAGPRW